MAVASRAAKKVPLALSDNALTVLKRRYLIKDDQGKPAEAPEDLFWRVSRTIAAPDGQHGASPEAVEAMAEEFYRLMATRVWMPNSPTLIIRDAKVNAVTACLEMFVVSSIPFCATPRAWNRSCCAMSWSTLVPRPWKERWSRK